ncbi:MAG TPA: CBS domain-containing protein [Nitrososphaerales archaeon]|nr:CBS domain-containing protein [Nitrososphaerales archaeon]
MQRHVGPLARDFMGKGVVTISQESNVDGAIKAMDGHNIGSVVVLDNLGPCGVFTERDLLSRVLAKGKDPESTFIMEAASPKFPSITSSLTLEETATAMVEKKSRLMVFEGAELVGMVTPTDLVRVLRGVGTDFSILKVISTRLVTVAPESTVEAVVRLMDERKTGSVLVSEHGQWTGIFTERDLLKRVLASRKTLDTPVTDVATRPVITAEPGIFGREVAGIMATHGFKRLPLALEGEGVGIVTARDVVEAFAMANKPRAPRVDWVQWN